MPVFIADSMKAGPALYRRMGYGVALLLSSAGALVIEIVAGRVLAPDVGMSPYTWTTIITVVLAGLSVGHWIGGILSSGTRARSCRVLATAMLLAGLMAIVSLLLIRLLSPLVVYKGLDRIIVVGLLSTCLFFLPSFFLGLISPVLTKLAIDDAPMHYRGRVIGRMYALAAAGSVAGTLTAGYVHISFIGSIGTILAVAVTYVILGSTFVFASRVSARAAGALAVVAFAVGTGDLLGQHLASSMDDYWSREKISCQGAASLSHKRACSINRPARA